MSKGKKVTVIGTGNFGSTVAFIMAMNGTCHNVVLRGRNYNVAKGKALDMSQASQAAGKHTIVTVAETLEDVKDCDVIVITAGVPRRAEMTRADLLMINAKIMKDVVGNIMKYSPDAVILCVSNPLDIMNYVVHKMTGWDRNRIIGMAGALDGSRMAYQIAKKTGYSAKQTGSLVIGDHGENMIPLPHKVSIGDIPLTSLLTNNDMEEIIENTKNGAKFKIIMDLDNES